MQAFLEKIFWCTIEPLLYNKAPKRVLLLEWRRRRGVS